MGTQTVRSEGNALSDEALELTNRIAKLQGDINSYKQFLAAENEYIKTLESEIKDEEARERKE
ncbi:hypothetical protein QNH46_24270 [Paenibacillus woosongensis]|uniref:Uncharacterized protein n=1 Tax=Paenibacillus woosongensis TaxID=307580 RepID=A0AA95I6W6_9BACL|nr:hypothetical protein [Paenibacillus woosongensis]WHX49117.1 hypothetical protein QNH46_24270 [Paenibacillus woosongensis]